MTGKRPLIDLAQTLGTLARSKTLCADTLRAFEKQSPVPSSRESGANGS